MEVNKELILSYFARKTSPIQRELIAQWLQEPANQEQYYDWLEEWENRHPQYRAQTDKALHQYTTFIADNPHTENFTDTTPVVPMPNPWNYGRWLVAASVLAVLSIGGWLFRDAIRYQTIETTYGETRQLQLTDGSTVLLNANSSLRVPRWGFGATTREVKLAGEATFSVTHMPDSQKFVVQTANKLAVVVLGTEFSVFARRRGARVVLNKGKVQLHYQEGTNNRQVIMKPGDLITLDAQNRIERRTIGRPPQQVVGLQNRFVFDETTLQEVAYLLEENYGLQVSIKDQVLAERVLMGSFRADNVDQLLQSISELLDISIVRQGKQVQITEK